MHIQEESRKTGEDTEGCHSKDQISICTHKEKTQEIKLPIFQTIGNVAVGASRKNRTLSALYRNRIFYVVDRAIISVQVEEEIKDRFLVKTKNTAEIAEYDAVEYITTVESTISAMHIRDGTISLGTVSGEIVLMDMENKILFKDNIQTGIYSISHTERSILVAVQYALLQVEISGIDHSAENISADALDAKYRECGLSKRKYQVIHEMNDIVLFSDTIETRKERILIYSNSNSIFIGGQCIKYTGNIMFTRAISLPDGSIRIVTGLSTRKVHIYTYKDEIIKLQHLITTKGLITDGILLPTNTLIVLNNSINIYDHRKQMECVGMVGPYDEDITKVLLVRTLKKSEKTGLERDKDNLQAHILNGEHEAAHIKSTDESKLALSQILNSLYIILDSGGIFKYLPQKKSLTPPEETEEYQNDGKKRTEIEASSVLCGIYNKLNAISKQWSGTENISSGNTGRIKSLHVSGNCIITASGPWVRIFKVQNRRLCEVFRPIVDGFPINGVISDWNGQFLANSNNILKVYTPTQLYNIVINDMFSKIETLAEEYEKCLVQKKTSINTEQELAQKTALLRNKIDICMPERIQQNTQLPFTAVKQELSLTTVPVSHPSTEEIDYIYSTIQCDLGLANNHLVEKEKIYGFPFEISTITKAGDSMVLISCSSSQKEFSNLFVLNSQLEIVQKIFVHSKTITHVLVSNKIVATIGKDRRIAVYKVCLLSSISKAEHITIHRTEKPGKIEDFGLELLDTRIDHRKSILAACIAENRIVTSSRDKTLITYTIDQEKLQIETVQQINTPITAVKALDKAATALNTSINTRLVLGDDTGHMHIGPNKHKIHNSAITHIDLYRSDERDYFVTASEDGVLKIIGAEELQK